MGKNENLKIVTLDQARKRLDELARKAKALEAAVDTVECPGVPFEVPDAETLADKGKLAKYDERMSDWKPLVHKGVEIFSQTSDIMTEYEELVRQYPKLRTEFGEYFEGKRV